MLAKHETKLEGRWLFENGQVTADAVAQRIEQLVSESLQQVAVSPDGWGRLFVDSNDQRLWELSFPESEMHGGGPPMLKVVSIESAKEKYGYAALV